MTNVKRSEGLGFIMQRFDLWDAMAFPQTSRLYYPKYSSAVHPAWVLDMQAA